MDGQDAKEVNNSQKVSEPQPVPVHSNKKRFVIGIIILLICIPVAFGLYYSTHKQAPADTLLATVGDQKISKSAVEKAAEEQYIPSAINNTVLRRFFDIAVERAILDNEAKKLDITVSPADINSYLTENHLSAKGSSIAKYAILKDKIIAMQTRNVSVYKIGFWIPSYDYPQKPEYVTLRLQGAAALNEIERRLKNGEDPITITETIYNKYPILDTYIALNGYVFEKTKNKSLFTKPISYILKKEQNGQPLFDAGVYEALSTMAVNEVKQIDRNDGSGGDVYKIITASQVGYLSYQDFLNAEKKKLLKIVKSL